MTLQSAGQYCRSEYNTQLASIVGGNPEERDEIVSLCGSVSCWIGLLSVNGDFGTGWGDGNDLALSIPNWEPGDRIDDGISCVRVYGPGGYWIEKDCFTELRVSM